MPKPMSRDVPVYHLDKLDEKNKKAKRKKQNWNRLNIALSVFTFGKKKAEALLSKGATYTGFYMREQGLCQQGLLVFF